jgi:hypothetical protein
MTASAWLRLLRRNRLAISPTRIPLALQVSLYSTINSMLHLVQESLFGRAIAQCQIAHAPIFVIGHWRTGTTFLHTLLALDEKFVAPNTLECFVPSHSLISAYWLRLLLEWFLPRTRPMDEIPLRWDQPQEDEFALLNLGMGTPYEILLFPNHRPAGIEFLNMSGLTPAEIEAWTAGLLHFLKQVQFRSNRENKNSRTTKRLIVKSPAHTARLSILRRLFPDAKFIHLVRHPYEVFESTIRLWQAMCDTQGCQRPRLDSLSNGAPALEEYVLQTMELLYHDFPFQIGQLPSSKFCELRYEDLVRAPIAELGRIYSSLDLGAFERVQPAIERHLALHPFRTLNRRQISDACKAEVRDRWQWYMERYDYSPDALPFRLEHAGSS